MHAIQQTRACSFRSPVRARALVVAVLLSVVSSADERATSGEVPSELRAWLCPQRWQRDTDGPIVSLGKSGEFDDTHIFAPAVAEVDDRFMLWYCGSRGTVAERVFRLGLATGRDGKRFDRHPSSPVFDFGDGKHSILTPTLLRGPDGRALREDGKLRMWFSSTYFKGQSKLHTLHETTSTDGIHWTSPSPVLLADVYAPTIIKTGRFYEMWYTDVAQEPWVFRHARSLDGRAWRVTAEPVLQVSQAWEKERLFYPTVVKVGGAYLMWYGSYWTARADTTALGFAVSLDGIQWHKHPQNPVLRPETNRPWESHYVTSQSVVRRADGSFRIWYASRKEPPFLNKYFAVNTARWAEPEKTAKNSAAAGGKETLTVAVVSSRSMFGDVDANLRHFTELVEQAADKGARLVCFPELALVSYSTHPDVLKSAEEIPGPATGKLEAIARSLDVYLSVGMAERDGDRHHITQVLVGPDGYLGKYRKSFPTGSERACGFSPGRSFPTWDVDGFRMGILICADGRQQDTIQAMKRARVDLIHHPHGNTVGNLGREAEEWTRSKTVYFVPRAVQARAHILVNNSAEDTAQPHRVLRYASGAVVIDALGQVVSRTTQTDRSEKMVFATLQKPETLIPAGELKRLQKGDPVFKRRFNSP